MSDENPNDRKMNRRSFFRDGLRQLFEPMIKNVADPIERAAKEFNEQARRQAEAQRRRDEERAGAERAADVAARAAREAEASGDAANSADDPSTAADSPRTHTLPQLWLRPPGALPEQEFLEECSRCGECVIACPVQAIQLETNSPRGKGAPFIDANERACVMCEDLACMYSCPTGALDLVSPEEIDMGVAVWRSDTCLRTTEQCETGFANEECTLCVEACPVGSAAIETQGDAIRVHPMACTGCGKCQQVCPTDPRAISVIPVAARG